MTTSRSESVVELDRVSFAYPARRGRRRTVQALQALTFSLPPGSITGLVGVNGAGKTTLIELVIGAIAPDSGTLRWFGRDRWGLDVLRRIGFCPDVPVFPPFLEVRGALRLCAELRGLPRADAERAVDRWLERLDLVGPAGQRISRLSRGNLVRVGLAQALLGTPDLLLLDESFAPLDPVAQAGLRTILQEEAGRGTAILISSHQLDQLEKIVDQALILDRGTLVHRFQRSGAESLESALLETTAEGARGAHRPREGDG